MYVPLTVQNKKIGVLSVQSFKKNAYTDYDLGILRNLAVYVAIALENARLYQNTEEEVRQRTAEVTRAMNLGWNGPSGCQNGLTICLKSISA